MIKTVMGISCYDLKEASKLYGEKNSKVFWRILDKLGCPRIQPGGVGTKIYFPRIQFDQWMAKCRISCTRRLDTDHSNEYL